MFSRIRNIIQGMTGADIQHIDIVASKENYYIAYCGDRSFNVEIIKTDNHVSLMTIMDVENNIGAVIPCTEV